MTLLVSDVARFVRRRMDGEPESLSMVAACNLAGRHLVSMHPWEWLVRPPLTLSLNSGSSEVWLPADFGRIDKLETSGSLLNAVSMTTPAHLLELETSTVSLSNIGYWAAVIWRSVDSEVRPVIRVWPSAGSSDTFKLYYFAGWADLQDDEARIPVPPFIEALYVELVCAFAQGYEEHDLGSLGVRLEEIGASVLARSAMSMDGGVQDDLGELRHGAADTPSSFYQAATIVGGPYRPS